VLLIISPNIFFAKTPVHSHFQPFVYWDEPTPTGM
jgi:hypothetical protein